MGNPKIIPRTICEWIHETEQYSMTSFIFNKGTYSRETTRFGLRMCTNECLEVLKYYASSKSIDPFVLSPSLGLFP